MVEQLLGPPENKKEYEGKYRDSSSVYLNYYSKRLSLLFLDKYFSTIFLNSGVPYSYEKGEFSQYQFQHPLDISFDSEISHIQAIYGEPTREGKNQFCHYSLCHFVL